MESLFRGIRSAGNPGDDITPGPRLSTHPLEFGAAGIGVTVKSRLGIEVHSTSVRRWLKRLRYGYRRAHPIHCIRDPKKSQRLQAIAEVLAERQLVWNKDTTDHNKNGDQGRTSTGSSLKPIDKIVMSSDCSAPTLYSSTETRVLTTNSSADEKSREFRKSTSLSSE